MSDSDEPSIAFLLEKLEHPDPVIRCKAAKEIGRRGTAGVEAVPGLVAAAADPDPMVRSMAASALGKIGTAAADAVPALTVLLEDPVVPVRFWAADALGRIGAATAEVRRGLETLAGCEHPMAKAARSAARRALHLLGAENDPRSEP